MATTTRTPVVAEKGIKHPAFSQAMICNGMIYVSGNIGMDYSTMKLIEGSIGDRVRQALQNIQTVLEEAGSGLGNIVKGNVYLTNMADFDAVNEAYIEVIGDPKPARTCVSVKELPFGTDVEIECIAHL